MDYKITPMFPFTRGYIQYICAFSQLIHFPCSEFLVGHMRSLFFQIYCIADLI